MLKRPFPRRREAARLVGGLATLIVLVLLSALAIPHLDRLAARDLSGRASVIDGDTLVIAGERIRLVGIDAPELAQQCRRAGVAYGCGREARAALSGLAGSAPVTCSGWARDRYGRWLATCRSEGGNLNADMVADGWAVAFGAHEAEQAAARAARRGLWAGDFQPPADWRRDHGIGVETAHDPWRILWQAIAPLLGIV